MIDPRTIRRANDAGLSSRRAGAPLLSTDSDRETLIEWLVWNDPNGSYRDGDDDWPPLTLAECQSLVSEAMADEIANAEALAAELGQ